MKIPRWLTVVVVLGLLLGSVASIGAAPGQQPEKVKVLIGFTRQPGPPEEALVRGIGGTIRYTYHLVPAIAATVPEGAIDGLRRNPNVTSVDLDREVWAIDTELDNAWGVKRIGAGTVHASGNKGTGVTVAIIDSGIDYTHPDLNDNYVGGRDFVQGDDDPMDVYGHGTHVAGTACAEDNDNGIDDATGKFGVVGVAPQCALYSLRVLNDDGGGYWSDIIAAMQWAVDNSMQVANLSLGSSFDPGGTVKLAFDNAEAAGVVIVAAAGNSGNPRGKGNNVIYPAKYDSVIAVAATDSSDERASFSSTGDQVELAAPGVAVFSTWNDSDSPHDPQPVCHTEEDKQACYKYGSGTSMASPHVAGTAALVIASGITDANGDGKINDEVRLRLQETADDLGPAGWDSKYGYGLVDADEAAPPAGNLPPVADAGLDQTASDSDGDGVEAVTLDGSASYDPDGTITAYEWTESEEVLSTAVSFTYSFAVGTHTVTLTVADNEGATATDDVVITVSEPPAEATMHVAAIDMELADVQRGPNLWTYAIATVAIVDESDQPVEGATVYGHWSGATSDSDTGVTGADGTVSLQSDKVKNAPSGTTFAFTVDNVVLSGWTYDSTQNVKTSD